MNDAFYKRGIVVIVSRWSAVPSAEPSKQDWGALSGFFEVDRPPTLEAPSKAQKRTKRIREKCDASSVPGRDEPASEEASARSARTKYGAATSAGWPLRATAPGVPRGAGKRGNFHLFA